MDSLLVIALAGFLASAVDGALGMGFGPTSASILLSTGLSPAATSATVNVAKIATGLAAGVSHWRFGNVDRRLVLRLAVPGAVGALVGGTVLTNVDGAQIRPFLALMLLVVGARIAYRFSVALPVPSDGLDDGDVAPFSDRGVEIAGATGGLTNGLVGAWGPVVTPYLLQRGLAPRLAVGSVNTAEVAVAIVSVGSLSGSLGSSGASLAVLGAMLVGGVVAAPLAAYIVRYFPARLMGLAVANLLLITQSRELANAGWLPVGRWMAYGLVAFCIIGAGIRPRLSERGDQRASQASGFSSKD